MKKIQEMSTIYRLLSSFLLIICPVIILGFVLVVTSSRRIEDEMYRSIHTQMEFYMEKFEADMQRIWDLGVALMANQDLNQLAGMPELYSDYEKSRAILRVQNELNAIKSSQPYISEVRVYIPSIGWSVNAEGYTRGSYTEITEEEINCLKLMKRATGYGLTNENGNLSILLISEDMEGGIRFIVEISFSKTELEKEFDYSLNIQNNLFLFEIPELEYRITNMEDQFIKRMMQKAEKEKNEETLIFPYQRMKYAVFGVEGKKIDGMYYESVPRSELAAPLQYLLLLSLIFFIVVVICICTFIRIACRLVDEPLTDLVKAFGEVEKGNFSVRLNSHKQMDFGYLYHEFNQMTQNLQELINKVYKQKMLLQKTELKQLQAQINPHFLYNSYFLLHRLIKGEDYEKAVLVSREMGTYFKYITRNGNDIVELWQENEHARIYADMQGMRFTGRIQVIYGDIPEKCRHIHVPRLIIQPIIENAFGYGLENKERYGILRVSFHELLDEKLRDATEVSIKIEDNGEELTEERLSDIIQKLKKESEEDSIEEITGIMNINRRIRIFCGDGSGVFASRSELGGLCVEIRILNKEKRKESKCFGF